MSKKNKAVLFYPKTEKENFNLNVPLSLLKIGSALKGAGYDVRIIDERFDAAWEKIRRGWYFGSETFREMLLERLGRTPGEVQEQRRRGHTGAQTRDHGVAEALRVVRVEGDPGSGAGRSAAAPIIVMLAFGVVRLLPVVGRSAA